MSQNAAWRPGTISACDAGKMLAQCPAVLDYRQSDNFTWANDTGAEVCPGAPIILMDPDDGTVYGFGTPACAVCPCDCATLRGMPGPIYRVALKPGEGDIPQGKKIYIEVDAAGKVVGATTTQPAIGFELGRALANADMGIKCVAGGPAIVAKAGAKCVYVHTCPCSKPAVFGL